LKKDLPRFRRSLDLPHSQSNRGAYKEIGRGKWENRLRPWRRLRSDWASGGDSTKRQGSGSLEGVGERPLLCGFVKRIQTYAHIIKLGETERKRIRGERKRGCYCLGRPAFTPARKNSRLVRKMPRRNPWGGGRGKEKAMAAI